MLLKKQIGSFRYTPHYGNNRDLPERERMSVRIRPMTRLELVAQAGWEDDGGMAVWRREALAKHEADPGYGKLIAQLPATIQAGLRQFVEHVSEPLNVVIEDADGERHELTDAAEMFLHLVAEDMDSLSRRSEAQRSGGFATAEEAAAFGLIAEIQWVVGQTAMLRGDELKNFASLCGGSNCLQSTATPATDAPATIPPAPDAAGT
jgi:hypothetical protein